MSVTALTGLTLLLITLLVTFVSCSVSVTGWTGLTFLLITLLVFFSSCLVSVTGSGLTGLALLLITLLVIFSSSSCLVLLFDKVFGVRKTVLSDFFSVFFLSVLE